MGKPDLGLVLALAGVWIAVGALALVPDYYPSPVPLIAALVGIVLGIAGWRLLN
jgi:hypothetical protein